MIEKARMEKCALLIFVKQPIAGKVKTRLAATVGDEKALQIYRQLLERTRAITQPLTCQKTIFYTPEIVEEDTFNPQFYKKTLQSDGDLGERMQTAFVNSFSQGFSKVCIMGSDCFELNTAILEKAFELLDQHEVVIGPATDGGYYLLGMRKLHPLLFQNKNWSTSSVFPDTVADLKNNNLSFALLPKLTDVDEEKDLVTLTQFGKKK